LEQPQRAGSQSKHDVIDPVWGGADFGFEAKGEHIMSSKRIVIVGVLQEMPLARARLPSCPVNTD